MWRLIHKRKISSGQFPFENFFQEEIDKEKEETILSTGEFLWKGWNTIQKIGEKYIASIFKMEELDQEFSFNSLEEAREFLEKTPENR